MREREKIESELLKLKPPSQNMKKKKSNPLVADQLELLEKKIVFV